ncbi:hypothetical protein EK904_000205 [Melospiza melodia maxima]|nr:hypothetical protein EK904_000205 [Melospiza melodia maxima]
MASFFTATLKSFQGGKDESAKGAPKDEKAAALPSTMGREEFEEYQRQLLEEKPSPSYPGPALQEEQGDLGGVVLGGSPPGTGRSLSPFPAPPGRAPRLSPPDASPTRVQDERDDAQVHVAGGAVELPPDLAAMVHSEEEEEEDGGAGAFAFLAKLRQVELPALRERALGGVEQVRDRCALM